MGVPGIAGPQGPAGPAGPAGPRGPAGTFAAFSCDFGEAVTGFDDAGQPVCADPDAPRSESDLAVALELELLGSSRLPPVSVIARCTATLGAPPYAIEVDFGDGTVVSDVLSGEDVPHVYEQAGNFAPACTVLDAVGTQIIANGQDVAVEVDEPVLVSLSSRNLGDRTFEFRANVTAGNAPFTYDWLFGDGTSQTAGGELVLKSYAESGSYTVTVEVTDVNGDTGQFSTGVQARCIDGESLGERSCVVTPPAGFEYCNGGIGARPLICSNGSAVAGACTVPELPVPIGTCP
jgi:hypothetical protein